ncbi:uncharacterized protein LOC124166064 isoform X2 [Ischnura elegans]|nr:uncharacterized protein LOC124166064 isoform X2 [Ischnura elegans]
MRGEMRGEIERHISLQHTTKMHHSLGCLKRPSFLAKIAEIAITSVLLGLYVSVYQWLLVYGDVHQMVLPFPVCGSFLIITGLICFAHLCGQRTPTYLVMAYDVQGALLFAAVGVVCFVCWGKATGESNIGPPPIRMPPTLDRPAILATAILGIVNSLVYAVDTVLTYQDRLEP